MREGKIFKIFNDSVDLCLTPLFISDFSLSFRFNTIDFQMFYLIFKPFDFILDNSLIKDQGMSQKYIYFHHDKYLTKDFYSNNFIGVL